MATARAQKEEKVHLSQFSKVSLTIHQRRFCVTLMIPTQLRKTDQDPIWSRYRDNFPRQVLAVTRHLETQIMQQLAEKHGFTHLRLYFEPYISMVPQKGIRLTEIAAKLQISRQAANQAANQIQSAGYIERTPDPTDGRAKRITLTSSGMELRRKGLNAAIRLEAELAILAGSSAATQSAAALLTFCEKNSLLGQESPHRMLDRAPIIGLLPRFGSYISQRLMELVKERGHPKLKLSFGHVLTFIGPEGGRIFQIAALQNVSKQAISAISQELEEQGYIYREVDPGDARQMLLRFTLLGRKLIEDSVDCIDDLEGEIRACVGKKSFQALRSVMQESYHSLKPEISVFKEPAPNVELLAQELKQRLTLEGCRHLAFLLTEAEQEVNYHDE